MIEKVLRPNSSAAVTRFATGLLPNSSAAIASDTHAVSPEFDQPASSADVPVQFEITQCPDELRPAVAEAIQDALIKADRIK